MPEEFFFRVLLADGLEVKRGDAILLQRDGHVMTGHVDTIAMSDDHPYVNANVMSGRYHPPGGKVNPVEYMPGLRHISAPKTITGIRFCLISEGEEGEAILRGDFEWRAKQNGPVTPVDTTTAEGPRVSDSVPPPLFDPADVNRDGIVSDKEQRKHDRRSDK